MAALLQIDNTWMPGGITTYDLQLSDIDGSESGRTESGKMTRNRVRADVASIAVGWEKITESDLSVITNSIKKQSFPVRYFYGSGMKSANMYASDKQINLVLVNDIPYWSIKFNLIEM